MSKPQIDNDMQKWVLNAAQRKRLQQQMQQHVQLLTQIHLLASANPSLSSEANTTKMFLKELGTFAQSSVVLHHQFNPKFQTTFQPCNLKGALQLIEDFHSHISVDLSPRKNVKESATEFPCMPKQVAWILATSKVFMYPELLPIRSLKVKNPRDKIFFTKAEDNLLALGLKHFEGTEFPKPLISKYLLTAKSAHQLTVRIKNLNNSRAPDNIIKYYKKTKLLPILFKCCEDLQPDQWKPPVEREERHLPFWLKASLPSIQEEIQHLANDSGESRNMAGFAETSSEPGLESKNDGHYPLLLPKGVVLTLKPLAKRFSSRRIWRQRSSGLKPLLIRPVPSLQPCSNDNTGVRVAQSKAPPSKVEISNSQLIRPAPVLHTRVPEASPSAATGRDGIPMALPAITPESGTPTPSMSQSFLSPTPATFPSPVTPKLCVSGVKPPKRKWAKASRLLKPTPVLPSPSVILTVPATVIQPLTAVAQSPQTIPITALLLSPTSFICPLNQPFIASSLPPLIVSGNPVSLPVPLISEENTQVKPNIPPPQAEGESAFPAIEPKTEPQEPSSLCPCPYPKEEHSPGPPTPGRESQVDSFEGNTHSWTVVKTLDGRQVLEPLSHTSQKTIDFLQGNLLNIVKVEPEEPGEEADSAWNRFPEPGLCDEIKKEVFMELDVDPPYEEAGGAPEVKKEAVLGKQEEDTVLGSLFAKTEESSGVGGLSVGTLAGPETGGEKDGPEEEEDDLDDPDQDEEMASISEESVHSGPELQETEKLTCLVSGRCVGPERDSEEEKPQKESSGPADVVKVEEMKRPKKEDEVMAEAGRDPSFHVHFT